MPLLAQYYARHFAIVESIPSTFVWKVLEGIWQKAPVKAGYTISLDDVGECLTSTQCTGAL